MSRPRPIPNLLEALRGAGRLAVLGVGSELRGDDFAGVLVARKVQAFSRRAKIEHVTGFEGCAAPENLTGAIARFRPDLLIVVDAAYLGASPGEVRVVPEEAIAGVTFSTHMLPVPIVLDYLRRTCGCRGLVVGIQPEHTEVCGPISAPVDAAIKAVVATVRAAACR